MELLAIPVDECQNVCYITNRTREQMKAIMIISQVPQNDTSGFSDGAKIV